MTGRALWITGYDLPAEGRDAYLLKWAHETRTSLRTREKRS